MPKIVMRVNFDVKKAAATIRTSANRAVQTTGMQALQDAQQYVPRDQNTLRDSGIRESGKENLDLTFVLRWSESYAQYLFHGEVMYGNPTNRTYGPEKLKFTEALARMKWTEYAYEIHGKEWKKVCQAALRKGIKV